MVKKNVVVAEQVVKATTVTSSANTPAPSMLPCPPRGMSAACPMNKKKYLKQLEIGQIGPGGGRINPCVDSMKASSPTAAAMDERKATWMASHPSALDMFEEIFMASAGKQIVVFLDYDGTLSPIVADPDSAFMSEPMRDVVKEVAKCFPTAIVSGRRRDKVYDLVQLGELYYAGSHGMDIKGPAKCPIYIKGATPVMFQPATEFAPMIEKVFNILVEKITTVPGARVENHKFCLSVHYRCVDEKRWTGLAEEVKSVLQEYPKLLLTHGRKVLDIRPTIKWDKGKALEFLLESLGFGECSDVLPVYIGDDRTDEDAFKVLRGRGQGVGILVSNIPKETNASYSLQEPSEVMAFLRRLVDWKKLSQGTVKGG